MATKAISSATRRVQFGPVEGPAKDKTPVSKAQSAAAVEDLLCPARPEIGPS
jgi:hypothetical protein